MGKWYIDRSRNIGSIVSSIHFDLLKELIGASSSFVEPQDLIEHLQIDGANKNALLTCFRDLGLIDAYNKPSRFFIACTKSNMPVSIIVLLILLKRNDEKKGKNLVKPFVVIAKALSLMIDHNVLPKLTWGICDDYLMKINSYQDINWANLSLKLKINYNIASTAVLDIWFNALVVTGLFDGDKKNVELKREFFEFIRFIADYGEEMLPSHNRDEYLLQANDDKYGWYSLFASHAYEAVLATSNLPMLIHYVQHVAHMSSSVNDENKPPQNNNDIGANIPQTTVASSNDLSDISLDSQYEELFMYYLLNSKSLSEHTVFSYFQSLRRMKDLLLTYEGLDLKTEIYFITSIAAIIELIRRFESNKQLTAINKECHYSISAAYNNYRDFLKTMGDIS